MFSMPSFVHLSSNREHEKKNLTMCDKINTSIGFVNILIHRPQRAKIKHLAGILQLNLVTEKHFFFKNPNPNKIFL